MKNEAQNFVQSFIEELAANIEAAVLLQDNARHWRLLGQGPDAWLRYVVTSIEPDTDLGRAALRCRALLPQISNAIWLEGPDGTQN